MDLLLVQFKLKLSSYIKNSYFVVALVSWWIISLSCVIGFCLTFEEDSYHSLVVSPCSGQQKQQWTSFTSWYPNHIVSTTSFGYDVNVSQHDMLVFEKIILNCLQCCFILKALIP